ncbi:MAG: PEP-CTERM sorting domain-containing protein [Nostoc sp.]|uniref:PEP-CTERM sorting domain-containing protein n=1 Tax=Nostoc sp. TaxID=1180 RepID=UPI002FF4A3EF
MNKQFSANALVTVISLLGVSSAITPASASLITAITTATKIEVPKTVQSVTTTTNTAEVGKGVKATVQETTNTSVGQLAGVATDSKTTAQVKDPNQVKLPSLDNPTQIVQTTGQAAVGIKADQQSTQADAKANLGVQITDLATVGICLDANATLGIANKNSSANCSKAVETPPVGIDTLAAAFETLQSVTTTTNTATAEVGKGVKATVQETTNTSVGQLAGVATDSKTTAQVKDPNQVKLPSLDNPTQIVQTTGQAAVGIKADQQSTQADAKANLGVQITDLATVGICLDANATLGIANKNSSANCSKAVETPPVGVVTLPVAVETPPVVVKTPPVAVEIPPVAVEIPPVEVEKLYVPIQIPSVGVKPHPVPEPTTLGGLALLGVYFISRRRRVS